MTESAPAPVRLAPGDPAPDFTLPDAEGKPVALSSYRGRRVIVYCYPAALTPGCTTQAVDFTAAALVIVYYALREVRSIRAHPAG